MEIFEYLEPLTLSVSKKKEARKNLLERSQVSQHPIVSFLESVEEDHELAKNED
jgi:hypothetical protein